MVKKSNIAQHSENSFIEKEAVRILSSFLEVKRTISTSFNENDKTPNHDGFFEILNDKSAEKIPKKQFIVQIKGTENLKQISTGKNKGKYKYSLNTNFLYYVKEKITENPAIYFVVDVKNNKIFWIYLSDKKLMSLNFEGKDKIIYHFSKEEECNDIDEFLNILNLIANERNQKFLYKTPDEIAEIQDAVSYLNNLFENDLKFIKNLMFPDLWRFGIAHSKIPQDSFTMSIGNEIITSHEGSNSFSVYPQIKGVADTGIRENNNLLSGINFFNKIDLTGNTTPMTYVNSVISQILKMFFDSSLIINLSSESIISEILSDALIKFKNTFDITLKNTTTEIESAVYILIKYIASILEQNKLSDNELSLKAYLVNIINRKQQYSYMNISFDLFDLIAGYNCSNSFIDFYYHHKNKKINLNTLILDFLNEDFKEYLIAIKRAKELDIKTIDTIRIDKSAFCTEVNEDRHESIKSFCKNWFGNLQKIYLHMYNEIFRDKKYLNSGLYKYQIINSDVSNLSWNVVKYPNNTFAIEESRVPIDLFNDKNAISVLSGLGLSNFILDRKILYNSTKCLLYQGITKALNLDCEGIKFNYLNNKLFEI